MNLTFSFFVGILLLETAAGLGAHAHEGVDVGLHARKLRGAQPTTGGAAILNATFSGAVVNADGSDLAIDPSQIGDLEKVVAQEFGETLGLAVPTSAVRLAMLEADFIRARIELLAVEICPPPPSPQPQPPAPRCLREALARLLLDLGVRP
eukprot:tig00020830_g14489.t1